jgi:hypothetical protein
LDREFAARSEGSVADVKTFASRWALNETG